MLQKVTAGIPAPARPGAPREQVAVAVVDQIPLFREGVAARIVRDPSMRLVGATGHLSAPGQLRSRHAVDVLLLDSVLDPRGHLTAMLTRSNPGLSVMALVREPYRTAQFVSDALAAGARGVLLKSSPAEQVMEAIRRCHLDGGYVDPALAQLVSGAANTPAGTPGRPLTQREYQVLQLIADGLSNQGVADALVVSVETVRTHIKSVLRKLDARDRAHAVARGFRSGLLAPQGDRPTKPAPSTAAERPEPEHAIPAARYALR